MGQAGISRQLQRTGAELMTQQLHVWVGATRAAVVDYNALDDRWGLDYAAEWIAQPAAWPLSPVLGLARPHGGYASVSIKRFIENLLPEGAALDVAMKNNGLARSNLFGLIWALGADTVGALQFTADADGENNREQRLREISRPELAERIALRKLEPFTVWEGKVRMSAPGLQDKLAVYLDRPANDGGKLFLVDGPGLASTHILKPDPAQARMPHLAVNEHFCMNLARRMGLPAAPVELLRLPHPVLVVHRFDREVIDRPTAQVQRRHVIDTCQACDFPVSFKYERNLGNQPGVRDIREGVSFERLFACVEMAANKAAARLTLLRWALFQFLIGNSDAHGKNISFFVQPQGLLEPAPWYDLVSVTRYPQVDHEMAMAWGDVFENEAVTPFAIAHFATRCGIDRKLIGREGQRLAKLAADVVQAQAADPQYLPAENGFVQELAAYIKRQSGRLAELVKGAATIKPECL